MCLEWCKLINFNEGQVSASKLWPSALLFHHHELSLLSAKYMVPTLDLSAVTFHFLPQGACYNIFPKISWKKSVLKLSIALLIKMTIQVIDLSLSSKCCNSSPYRLLNHCESLKSPWRCFGNFGVSLRLDWLHWLYLLWEFMDLRLNLMILQVKCS